MFGLSQEHKIDLTFKDQSMPFTTLKSKEQTHGCLNKLRKGSWYNSLLIHNDHKHTQQATLGG